jgi:hypothetical protein
MYNKKQIVFIRYTVNKTNNLAQRSYRPKALIIRDFINDTTCHRKNIAKIPALIFELSSPLPHSFDHKG